MVTIIILLIIIGLVVGIISGFFGIGGGVISIPFFVIVFNHFNLFQNGTSIHYAQGTTLAMMIFTSLASILKHKQSGIILWDVLKKMLFYVAIGVIIGGICSTTFPSKIIEIVFSIYLVIMGGYTLLNVFKEKEQKTLHANKSIWATIGTIVGFKSGLLGIGGGTVIIPILLAMRYPVKKVAGTSAVITFTVSCVGTLIYFVSGGMHEGWYHSYSLGYIYFPALVVVTPFSFCAAKLGVKWNKNCSPKLLKILFAAVLIALGINMFR